MALPPRRRAAAVASSMRRSRRVSGPACENAPGHTWRVKAHLASVVGPMCPFGSVVGPMCPSGSVVGLMCPTGSETGKRHGRRNPWPASAKKRISLGLASHSRLTTHD